MSFQPMSETNDFGIGEILSSGSRLKTEWWLRSSGSLLPDERLLSLEIQNPKVEIIVNQLIK